MTVPEPQRGRPRRASLYAMVDQSLADLARIGGLPHPTEAEGIWAGIWHEETHHSTAIEGNTLALRQVRILLEEGRAVGNKDLREYLEVQGYAEAARWVYEQATPGTSWNSDARLTVTELREIHRLVVGTVWAHFPPEELHPEEGPGAFRRHELAPFPGGMQPPAWIDVPPLLNDWLQFANGQPRARDHLIEHLALAHARFEEIHPFRDGNGRTGRLALNLLLVRHGYPPAIIRRQDRPRYIAGLQQAHRGEDAGQLAELVARAVKDTIERFLLPGLAGPHRLLPLSVLASDTVTVPALRLAIDRGRLHAVRREGRWYTTRDLVDRYLASRHERRDPGRAGR